MKIKKIMIILLVVVSLFTCYYWMDRNSKKELLKKTSKEKKTETITQEEKKQLKDIINNIEGFDVCNLVDQYNYENGCLYQKDSVLANELDFSYKLYSLILNHQSEFKEQKEEIKWNEKTYSVEKNISEEYIKTLYQKLYGNSESFDPKSVNQIHDDDRLIYDEQKHLFYLRNIPLKDNIVKKYIYRYQQKNEIAYIDVSVSFIQLIGKDKYTNYEAYREKEKINLKAEGIYQELNSFQINSDNYKEYSQYRYTFKKGSDQIYHFVELEKIK